MARPIKETPVLKGKDARKFEAELKKSESRKVSSENYKRAMATYERIGIKLR